MAPQTLLLDAVVHDLARVVLHFLWQGALLGLLAACVLHVATIRTAHARYAFHGGLLLLLAICPLLTWFAIGAAPVGIREIRGVSAHESGDGPDRAESRGATSTSIATQPGSVQEKHDQARSRPYVFRRPVAEAWIARHAQTIVTAWLAGVCFMAARLGLAVLGVSVLVRRRSPLPPGVAMVVERLSRRLAFRVCPAVHVVERGAQALAVGVLKPMVLLPAAWVSELPTEVLEAVIAHELAHLRRWDLPVNFLQRVVESVLFFHPTVWWCSRRIRIAREMCCDDLAQAAIGNRVIYAKALAYLAHQQAAALEPMLAAGIGGRNMVLLERIRNVLGMVPRPHGRLYGPSCALLGAGVTSLAWAMVLWSPVAWQAWNASVNEPQPVVAHSGHPTPPAMVQSMPSQGSMDHATKDNLVLDQDISAGEPASLEPLTLDLLKFQSYWDLTLQGSVKNAMTNSKTIRSLGARYRFSGDRQEAAAEDAPRQPGVDRGSSARRDVDVSLAEFERDVLNLVNDTENAYWELSFAWRNLETMNTALHSARQTWKKIHRRHVADADDNEAKQEAQAREQYFQFKVAAQTLVNDLLQAENRLRYMMGVAPAEGQLIRPIDKPTVDKVSFDWQEITQEALARSPELRRQKWLVAQQELQLNAAKKQLQPRLNSQGKYRWRGLSDDERSEQEDVPKENDTSSSSSSPSAISAAESSDERQLPEFALGLQSTIPLSLRRELAAIRQQQLNLGRERAKLQEEELQVSHRLAEAVRQLEQSYQLTQTNFNRIVAADRQVEAVQAAFEAETVTLDQLLEAQRRRTEAQTSYSRTLLDYQRAIIAVHLRKGSLR